MSKIKDLQKEFIINEALKLFLNNSIEKVTMKDIAEEVGIGEATLYRYFDKKQNLVMLAAIKVSNDVLNKYFTFEEEDGDLIIKKFYQNFLFILNDDPLFFKFINEFDAYIVKVEFDSTNYGSGIDIFKGIYMEAYQKAVEQDRIRKIHNIESFYYATTHALLDLGKRLASKNYVISADKKSDKTEMQIMIDIILYSLFK